MRVEVLVAIDWSDDGLDIEPVRHFVRSQGGSDALVGVVPVDHVKPSGVVVPCWRVSFDADRVRNTEVHGVSYRAGFVSHVE